MTEASARASAAPVMRVAVMRDGAGYGGGGAKATGGGGGSSFIASSATNMSSALSARSGNGQVTITFDPTTDACPTTVVAAFTGWARSPRGSASRASSLMRSRSISCPPRALTGGHSRSLGVPHEEHEVGLTWAFARSRRSRRCLKRPYKAEVAGSRPAAPTQENGLS